MAEKLTLQARLIQQFCAAHPAQAAQEMESLPETQAFDLFVTLPRSQQVAIWERLSPAMADRFLLGLGVDAAPLIELLDPGLCARALARLDAAPREQILAVLDPAVAEEFGRLLSFPPGSAGSLMDLRPVALHADTRVEQARIRLQGMRVRPIRQLFLLDQAGAPAAVVDVEDLALARTEQTLSELGRPLPPTLGPLDSSEQIVAALERSDAEELPVLDLQGRLLGVIHARAMLRSVKDNALADLQTMVGVSQDERALSPVVFAVKRRIVWMHINLLTAFLAAAVVGLFENTIAQFTALAVLLPVVAGQSGNAGAQALAVTMRGLALREISIRQWGRLLGKECRVGVLNGMAVAVSTAVGVFLWSRSSGLSLVIGVSMVISMTMACIAGALVPVVLTRLRQDPATSSSIILTTVTDVAGFFSFLGIATLLSAWLPAG